MEQPDMAHRVYIPVNTSNIKISSKQETYSDIRYNKTVLSQYNGIMTEPFTSQFSHVSVRTTVLE